MEIGRFATASGLSVDALRHYDEVGVLKPASVDPRTSYRRYSAAQLGDARLVCSLRGVDLPVDEVREVMGAADEGTTREVLLRHRQRLVERANRLDQMLATSAAYVEKSAPLPSPRGCRVVQVMVATRDLDEAVDDPSGNRIQLSQG
jgi:DNA-binding transcriptional MerR regulator